MSHFNFENELNSVLRMDGPITKGPSMRFERKTDCNQSVNSSLNISTTAKTPMKNLNRSTNNPKTPSNAKTPKSTSKTRTPGGSKAPKTPSGGDRFIPNRSATQFELGHFKLTSDSASTSEADNLLSPSQKEYQKIMSENLNGADISNNKIISYKTKAPGAPEGYHNNLRVLYSSCKTPAGSMKKTMRHIPQVPERILDAPDILDDYYLNLLDWSCNNLLAVCLGGSVYLWNAATGEIDQLLQMESSDQYVGAVSWIKEGNYLAVGTSNGEVQLWDVAAKKRLRNMAGHANRVGALSWNSYILSSGSRSGAIHHHDVRVADHHVGTLLGHTQELCGLKWSPDGKFLASGGNDNLLNIWGAQQGSPLTDTSPMFTFSQHQAAVKALAWCPWQPHLLASGGGTADRHIRFWNCSTGTCVDSVDTKSQVCALLWSKNYKELISSHGFALNQLTIWKYPTMTKVSELSGHTARVLHMAMSPDGQTVVSAGADETLRIWKCFTLDEQKKAAQKSAVSKDKKSVFSMTSIR
ncbi:cell division cycle protein 20 homolog [Saccostrea echinata]|uniref:cell division cycle protein 20 homolog n=1 Tax=Saccostrea echinata TaxID=191078 RepID=UPI002A82C0CA|nr:cell division cycle protein 20 homolog [Saccostrea echinata]